MQKYNFTTDAASVIECATEIATDNRKPYVGTAHLMIALVLSRDTFAGNVLSNNGVTEEKIDDIACTFADDKGTNRKIPETKFSPLCEAVFERADSIAMRYHDKQIGTEHLLMAMLLMPSTAGHRMLQMLNVNILRMYLEIVLTKDGDLGYEKNEFMAVHKPKREEKSKTPIIDSFTRDLTLMAYDGRLDPVIGRDKEIEHMVRILCRRTKNNPCLVGEPGVGKTVLAEALASRIVEGNVPELLKNKRLLSLDLSAMVAGTKYRGEFEDRMKSLLREVEECGDVILFMDELHTIIGAGGSEGAQDASSILKPALARGNISVIGATTLNEYKKFIKKDTALERRFQTVEVSEPDEQLTFTILKGLLPVYEKHHEVRFSDEVLKLAISLSGRYVADRFQPDKSIDVMDEAAARRHIAAVHDDMDGNSAENRLRELEAEKERYVLEGNLKKAQSVAKKQRALENELSEQTEEEKEEVFVTPEDITGVISEWTQIPVNKLSQDENEKLLHLEETLKKRVVGQDEAVSCVARSVKRAKVGLADPNRPLGTFLFLGPTGVGKTELAKALAEALFGNESSMIRIDMSEYMEKHSVAKLIGAPPGYVGHEDGGQLCEKVRRKPYSVLLFDELEKAHEDVFNILLQVFEDGHMTDSQGHKVSFKNTIIIMTSNAGTREIAASKHMGFVTVSDPKADHEATKTKVNEEIKKMFKPEFLNRIDETIVFRSLGKDVLADITRMQLEKVADRCRSQYGFELKYSDKVVAWMFEEGYDEKYGARPIRRAIQTRVEDFLAEEILKGHISKGQTVCLELEKDENGKGKLVVA